MTPNTPGEIWWNKDYSVRKDMRINVWMLIAVLIAAATDIFFRHRFSLCPLAVRSFLAALPFAFLLLWIRSLCRWISGMDEMHKRIAVSSSTFAVAGTLWFLLLWHRLDRAGFFQWLFAHSKTGGDFDILTISHVFLIVVAFYAVGYSRYNRRYQ